MTEADLAWAAGFFDGEGCVDINSTNGRTGGIRALLSNTSLVGVERLQSLFGGSVSTYTKTNGNHPYYSWVVYSSNAAAFYAAILSYAVVKRQQIEIALAYHSRRGGKGRLRTEVEHMRDLDDARAIRRLRTA